MRIRPYLASLVFPLIAVLALLLAPPVARGEERQGGFIHPGGLHTREDLERMRRHVAAGDHPWIDSWNALLENPKAQLKYKPAPRGNLGVSRQRASADALAIYLNALRGEISGDRRYTDYAIEMCNQFSAAVDQPPHGPDQPGLNGIFTHQFAICGELLRMHVGTRWKEEDFARYQKMMRQYLYPPCHDFLVRHNGAPVTHWWANWDASCIAAVGATGVLCDDRALFDEAVEYFKRGIGNGCIGKAVYFIHPNGLGQWQEAGRDQEHGQLGVGLLATFCEIARHQGLDLYGYDNNRLLAGAEYLASYHLWKDVPYKFYTNADNVNQYWISRSGRGRLQRPIWDQIYNEYVVRRGLGAPNVTELAARNRPEGFTHDDHFGYGTLAFTLETAQLQYPPFDIPAAPQGLRATIGVGRVYLQWSPPDHANGFVVRRATTAGGPYEEIARYRGVIPEYYDERVTNGTTYYYVVAAENESGVSGASAEINVTPAADAPLPKEWSCNDIGRVGSAASGRFAAVGDGTFIVKGAGSRIDGKADSIGFASTNVTGDFVFTARLIVRDLRGAGGHCRVGIMIRSSLEPDAPCAALVIGDAGGREARFGTRAARGEAMSFVLGNGYSATLPTWFRLERRGDMFTAYQSDDGQQWFKVSSADIRMEPAARAGIAIASDNKQGISVTFDHVLVVPN